jgi:hypothetical protein
MFTADAARTRRATTGSAFSACARRVWPALVLAVAFLFASHATRALAGEVENAPEVAGFWGVVTGTVKSADADGKNFVLKISKADFDPAATVLKDNAAMVGKELTIGTRMPKAADGVAHQHPDDVAYIKTLKPGMVITVKIFAPRSNPRLSRIQGPGKSADAAETPARK